MGLKGRTVLVTGAGGFIGSHLADRLVREGATVKAMVHYDSRPQLSNLEFVETAEEMEILRGDVRDAHFMRYAVEGCDVVFHLAALIGIPYSYVAPSSYVDTNAVGTLNTLQACRDREVPRLVHTSTSECYGTARYEPIDEAHPLQGQSPYSASKIGADKLAESYHLSFDLPVVTVRPFNTFGPRQSARAVIPTILSQLLSGAAELRLGSLEPERDFNYVENTVDGFVAAATAEGAVGEVVNVGSGRKVSIGEVAEKAREITGIDVPIVTEEGRVRPTKSEVEVLLCDWSKAKDLLGWEPRVTLEEGLVATAAFIEANIDQYRPKEYMR